jgi:hypothetical protein
MDYIVILKHEHGTAHFGPLGHASRKPERNVHDFVQRARRMGYAAEMVPLFPRQAWDSFTEVSGPPREDD